MAFAARYFFLDECFHLCYNKVYFFDKEDTMSKPKKWIRFRHRVVRNILFGTLGVYSRLRYGIRIEKFKEQGNRQYLVLFNHQTAFDQFFVGMSFRGPVYYMASEDLFSNGFVSSLIRYLVAPIPIKKQSTDVHAVINAMRVAREGGTIAIAPEGNRTYSGKTEYINPAISLMAKKLGLPIAFYRIEGGYGVHPRWSDAVRRGRMRSYVSGVLEPEEYKDMSADELYEVIKRELYVNEASVSGEFRHPRLAEGLERAIYVCPRCGLSSFKTERDVIECTQCGLGARYLPTKELEGVDGEFPFRFVADWYDYQSEFISALDTEAYTEAPLYRDEASFSEVIVYKKKELLRKTAALALYGDRMVVDEGAENELLLPFDEVSAISVLGRNKLNVYHHKKIYQFKGSKSFNALKYVNVFYRHKNVKKGEADGKLQFLGL